MQVTADNLPTSNQLAGPDSESLMDYWRELLKQSERDSAQKMITLLIAGGLAALYIRFLYRRFNGSASGTDSISRTFPLLLIITTVVISVVKSSLALSLGLVGALSIVRFRAAIKEPEELVYLFLCIAVGLALGAEKPALAGGLLIVATVLVLTMHATHLGPANSKLMLTIRGDAAQFDEKEGDVIPAINALVDSWVLHRMDIESGRGQLRIALPQMAPAATTKLIGQLSSRLPTCEFSYVNLNSAV